MGLLDALFTNGDLASKGLKEILGKQDFLLAYRNDSLECFFYDIDSGEKIIEKYYQEHNLDFSIIEIKKVTLNRRNDEFKEMLPKKIVLLDGTLELYEKVIMLANTMTIKGYNPKKLKNTFNKFFTT